MAIGAVVARILTQYSNKGSKAAQKDIVMLQKKFDAFGKKTAKAFGLATVASAAFAVKIGKDAVKGAMEDQRQQIALATALRNTTGATDEAIAATVTYLDKLELLVGVDNNQLIPSLQILTQATKDVTAAQQLQALALDISAGRTLDLGAVSLALAKAIGGNVGALTRLGVPLDADAVKAKDLNAILKSLGATFSGQAKKRAETFEFRLIKLQLAFNQIIDQLGYALIPVLEKFAIQLSTKILPQIQSFISLNKDKLAASLSLVADFSLKFLTVLISIGNWIANNTGLVKNIAILFATMFVATKVYGMITAVNLLTAALVRMNVAMGAGAIGAVTKTAARAGALGTAGVVLGGGSFFNNLGTKIAGAIPGTKANKARTAAGVLGSNFPMSPSASDVAAGVKGTTGGFTGGTSALDKFIASLNAATKATKAAQTLQDQLNKKAMALNLAKQATLSGSSTIAIGGAGSLAFGNKGTNVVVNVAGSVSTEGDLITAISNGLERTTRRSFGGAGRFGTSGSQ